MFLVRFVLVVVTEANMLWCLKKKKWKKRKKRCLDVRSFCESSIVRHTHIHTHTLVPHFAIHHWHSLFFFFFASISFVCRFDLACLKACWEIYPGLDETPHLYLFYSLRENKYNSKIPALHIFAVPYQLSTSYLFYFFTLQKRKNFHHCWLRPESDRTHLS